MATAVRGSSIKKVYGETVSLTTTAAHLAFMPKYHEVLMYCASDWRMGIAPKLASVLYFDGSLGTYTDYTLYAVDRASGTHVPLDAMAAQDYLYLGVTEPVRGFYFDIGTNAQATGSRTLDWEYMSALSGGAPTFTDVAGDSDGTSGTTTLDQDGLYSFTLVAAGTIKRGIIDENIVKLTGTVSGAFTVDETVTGGTSGASGKLLYGPSGATYIYVNVTSGTFTVGETATGGTSGKTCSSITAVGSVSKFQSEPLYWYRFCPNGALSATVDVNEIIPACDTVNYGYMQGGVNYQFSINPEQEGAFEFDHTGTGTLNVTWIRH